MSVDSERMGVRRSIQLAIVTFVVFRGALLLFEYVGVRLMPGAGTCRPQWQVFDSDFDYWNGFFRWDGAWYRRISEGGYTYHAERGSNVAFYPLFPYLARFVGVVIGNRYAAGLVVNHVATLLAIYFLHRLGQRFYSREVSERAVVFLLLFPTSFFLSAFYTEALYLCLAALSMLAFYEERYVVAGVAGGFATLSRSSGVVLFAALALDLAIRLWRRQVKFRVSMLTLLLIPAGLGVFMLILKYQVGDPTAFASALTHWGRHPSLPWVPIAEALGKLTPGLPASASQVQPMLDAITAIAFLAMAGVMAWRRYPIAFTAFVAFGVLLPLCTYNLTSMNRYVLVLFPAFFFLAQVADKRPLLERLWLFGSVFFLAIYGLRFMRCGWAG
jgi:hypothetical protein